MAFRIRIIWLSITLNIANILAESYPVSSACGIYAAENGNNGFSATAAVNKGGRGGMNKLVSHASLVSVSDSTLFLSL